MHTGICIGDRVGERTVRLRCYVHTGMWIDRDKVGDRVGDRVGGGQGLRGQSFARQNFLSPAKKSVNRERHTHKDTDGDKES